MSLLKVAQLSLKSMTLQEALKTAKSGDTISIGHKSIELDPKDGSNVIDKPLYIQGSGIEKTLIKVPAHMIGMLLAKGMTLHLSDLTIEIGHQANAILVSTPDCSLFLKNVKIVHGKKKIIKREFYPSFSAASDKDGHPFLRQLVIDNCQIDYLIAAAENLRVNNSQLGSVYNYEPSYLAGMKVSIEVSDLSLLILSSLKERMELSKVRTQGGLSLNGDAVINGLELYCGQSPQKYLKQIDFNQLAAYLILLNKVKRVVIVNGPLDYKNETPLYSLPFISGQNVSLTLKDLTLPKMEYKSSLVDGEITMESVTDNSQWSTKNVAVSDRASQSTLFSNEQSKTAMQKMDALIGLQSIKKSIREIVSSTQLNYQRAKRGMKVDSKMSLHMSFEGSAGTGKTTIARLFGQALYEGGILKTNKFVEVGKQDLVAGYKGQTAPKTHKVIMSALDGVLFIDEAYQLLGDKDDGGFENDAQMQLVADMENYRDRLVVIMAGYTNDMDRLFRLGNEGLASRFARRLVFPDYSLDELFQIMDLDCYQKKIYMTDGLFQGLATTLQLLYKEGKVKGNARYVRRFIEQLVLIRDDRLGNSDTSSMSDMELQAINSDDVLNLYKRMEALK